MATSPAEEFSRSHATPKPTLGISLSGGGHRATLIGLGALLAATETNHSHQIAWVSSVSGGSIASAVAYLSGDLNHPEATMHLSDAIRSHRSDLDSWTAPFVSPKARVLLSIWLLVAGIAVATIALGVMDGLPVELAIGLGLAYGAIRSRGRLLEIALDDLWLRRRGEPSPTFDSIRERGWTETSTTHVFDSVDLLSGQPVFIGTSYVATDGRLWTLGRVRICRAVRASASFPGLFPPMRIRLSELADEPAAYRWLRQTGSKEPPPEPDRRPLLLSDGGTYNNLGTHWTRFARVVDHDGLFLPPPVDMHLVIDSGSRIRNSASWLHRLPVIGPIITLHRTAMTTYHAGLDTEQARLMERSLRTSTSDCTKVRYVNIRFRARPDHAPGLDQSKKNWVNRARVAGSRRTDLLRVQTDDQASLIAHGYGLMIQELASAGVDVSGLGTAWRAWLSEAATPT